MKLIFTLLCLIILSNNIEAQRLTPSPRMETIGKALTDDVSENKIGPLSVNGSFGFLNAKLRLQYEHALGKKGGVGACLNYYLVNWTGPKVDFFARIYGKRYGNQEGFFFQGKLGYGNLSGAFRSDRWSTVGVGVATGYKFLVGEHFVIEQLLGVHIYSPPPAWDTQTYQSGEEIGEAIGWYLTTGLPLDFQLRFGYAF
jgi:hypothetical protein